MAPTSFPGTNLMPDKNKKGFESATYLVLRKCYKVTDFIIIQAPHDYTVDLEIQHNAMTAQLA